MKTLNILLLLLLCPFVSLTAQTNEKDKILEGEAKSIATDLSLDTKSEKLIYNVLYHVKTRLEDTPMGHANYKTLVGYIDQERKDMMRAILSPGDYEKYAELYGKKEAQKIKEWRDRNAEYVQLNGKSKKVSANMNEFKDFTVRYD